MPRLTLPELQRMMADAIRDKRYQQETRLGRAVAEYLAWARLKRAPRSLVIYEGYLARLCILLADRDPAIDEVTPEMLLDGLGEHEPGSFKIVRTSYNNLFEWALLFDRCARNPVAKLPKLHEPALKVYDVFTQAEQAQLAMGTDAMPMPWVQRLRVLCFLDLGVRKNEARGLQVKNFDIVGRTVVVNGKGNKERLVPLSDALWTALMQFRNRRIPQARSLEPGARRREDRQPRTEDYIFFPYGCSKLGDLVWTDPARPMSERGMHEWWGRVTRSAGVAYRSMHMARHTVATDLADADVDSLEIKDWLGHADVSTTQVYVHNSRSRLQRGRERLDEYRKAHG